MRARPASRRPGLRPGVAALALLAALGAACGVPTDGSPRALAPEDVPFDLLGQAPAVTTTTVRVGESEPARIFLERNGRLVPVERRIQAPASVEKVLRELVTGPTAADEEAGLGTSVNPATRVFSVSAESGIATIDLSDDFALGTLRNQIFALAQMVYTATELSPDVRGVLFTLEGDPAEVFTGDGTLTSNPVGRGAYAGYGPL